MYSDGIFDVQEVEVHSETKLPSDVMLLESLADCHKFLDSDCDLGLASLEQPDEYQKLVADWLGENKTENLDAASLEKLEETLPSDARALLQPYLPVIRNIYQKIPGALSLTLRTISDQMCPLFHVDSLKLRFMVTLHGQGTQWLQDKDVLRKNLGKGGRKPIAKPDSNLQQISAGQIALLKGLRFPGSKGLVHRSPSVDPAKEEKRVFLRVDFLG